MTDSVFTIVDEMERIDELLEASGGELTEELEAALDAVEGKFYDKAEKIGAYILNLKALEAVARDEMRRIRELAQVRANKVTRIQSYLKFMLESTGRNRVETATFKIGLYDNSVPSITWPGPVEEIPEAFRVVKTSLDGKAAQQYFKEHEKMPDGFQVEHSTHLRVR